MGSGTGKYTGHEAIVSWRTTGALSLLPVLTIVEVWIQCADATKWLSQLRTRLNGEYGEYVNQSDNYEERIFCGG
jgi:hypothetical protein